MASSRKHPSKKVIHQDRFEKGTDTKVTRVRFGIGSGKMAWAVADGPGGSWRQVATEDTELR